MLLKCQLQGLSGQAAGGEEVKNRDSRRHGNENGRFFWTYTLRMSLVIGLGPLDEKETTNGDNLSLFSTLLDIIAVGSLIW